MNRVFIIAEAGSNWRIGRQPRKNLSAGFSLIEAAVRAGADAVKFQFFRSETLYVPEAGKSGYLSRHGMSRSINDLIREMEMPASMLPKLAARCRRERIEFMCSAFSPSSFALLDPFVRRHKIASYEITDPFLLQAAARSRKPLILSTGASTVEDIAWAVRTFNRYGGKDLTLLQCTASYPAPLDALNLLALKDLERRFGKRVGLSDHSSDPVVAPVAATTLGATVIEKHFTLDRSLPGPDQAFAIEPRELERMVKAIRDCERSLGQPAKRVDRVERELRSFAQRAIQAVRTIEKGEILRVGGNIAVLRPGKKIKGLHPRFLCRVNGARARRLIRCGEGIRKGDFA